MVRKKKDAKKPNRVQVLVITWAVLMTIAVVVLLFRNAWPALVWAVNEIAGLVWHTRLSLSELAIEAEIIKLKTR